MSMGAYLFVAVVLVASIFFLGLIITIGYFIIRYRNLHQFKVFVFSRDSLGKPTVDIDESGGIFNNLWTKTRRFYIRKGRVGLNCDNVPSIDVPGSKKRLVLLVRYGLNNYRFLKPDLTDFGDLSMTVSMEDINWGIHAYERSKKSFVTGWLKDFAPYLALMFVGIVFLIIFLYFFSKLDVLSSFADSLNNAAQALANAKAPVIPVQ